MGDEKEDVLSRPRRYLCGLRNIHYEKDGYSD